MMCVGLYRHHRADFEQHARRMSPLLCSLFERGRSISLLELAASCCAADDYQTHLQRLFSSHDVVLTLVATGEAPAFEYAAGTGSSVFCSLWSLCGLPAVTVPVATSAHGLPLAVQLVGAYDADDALLDRVESVAELCTAGDQGSVIQPAYAQVGDTTQWHGSVAVRARNDKVTLHLNQPVLVLRVLVNTCLRILAQWGSQALTASRCNAPRDDLRRTHHIITCIQATMTCRPCLLAIRHTMPMPTQSKLRASKPRGYPGHASHFARVYHGSSEPDTYAFTGTFLVLASKRSFLKRSRSASRSCGGLNVKSTMLFTCTRAPTTVICVSYHCFATH